jgi:FAD/FMN-containing dehydrogenase
MAAACGMEVVLPSGEVLRTGMGAMPGNPAWHVYKHSLGPTLDPLLMQSNFGIVTKMGVWLMPHPECYMPLWLRVWNEDDLPALVETLRVRHQPDDRVVRRRGGRTHRLFPRRAADRTGPSRPPRPDPRARRARGRARLRGRPHPDQRPQLHPRDAGHLRYEERGRGAAYDTSRLLVREAAKYGYGEYRAHLVFMDLAAQEYSFGDHAYLRFAETIKDAVDPNGILSPGKQGIWPQSLREPRAKT